MIFALRKNRDTKVVCVMQYNEVLDYVANLFEKHIKKKNE